MLNKLINTHLGIISDLEIPNFHRFLFNKVEWNSKALAIIGARGTGKTTMLLQHYKENFNDPNKCLYILGDDGDVLNTKISIIAKEFYLKGGQVLIIDEVHKYPNWNQEIKNIYDKLPKLQLIISGSSNINIIKEKYDLSRRLATYHLPGLSFREYINLELNLKFESYTIKKILDNHLQISQEIKTKIAKKNNFKILQLFNNYLKHGYYPYYREGLTTFFSKLQNSLDKILYEDIPASFNVNTTSIVNLKKLLYLIGASHPFTVEIASIAKTLGTSRNSVYEYLDYLTRAELLISAHASGGAAKTVRKPAKLYLNNSNLYYGIGKTMAFENKIGTIRETFAFNQLTNNYQISVPNKTDILVDNTYYFEIGGSNKDFSQLRDLKKSYILSDNIEFGYEKRLPLYLLGFLY